MALSLDDGPRLGLAVVVDVLTHDLLDSELDGPHADLALFVLNLDFALRDLHWREHVLVELRLQAGIALRATAPGLDLPSLLDRDVLLQL